MKLAIKKHRRLSVLHLLSLLLCYQHLLFVVASSLPVVTPPQMVILLPFISLFPAPIASLMTLSFLQTSWTCKDVTNGSTLFYSHLEIEPGIIIGIIRIFSQLCYLFLCPRECFICFHTESSSCYSARYRTKPLLKHGDLQKLVSRYLRFDNV